MIMWKIKYLKIWPNSHIFHFQQRIFTYNDISLSAGLQDVVFQNNQNEEQMLSLNTDLLSFFVVLASEKDLGDYKMSTFMGFGTGGLGPMDSVKVISDSCLLYTSPSPRD